ncbi:hypothetical protein V9K67_24355 [Paraflavisolibacter sp. H34]|uniref:hypothetical protein n=1 Tax=Huijunlia imazamoxiresistens TaxID=3127457 RepID=UPI00301677DB
MKRLLLLFFLWRCLPAPAQLMILPQLPPSGPVQKGQLWSLVLTNTAATALDLHLELSVSDAASGQEVLAATTRPLVLATGTTQLHGGMVAPVLYAGAPHLAGGPESTLLPAGRYRLCYRFYVQQSHGAVLQECRELLVEPLSPPLLVTPLEGQVVEGGQPQFSWLPPAPLDLFVRLTYDLRLVEVLPEQPLTEAVQYNVPLLLRQGLFGTVLPYPPSARTLQPGKTYAWYVWACNAGVPVSASAIWTFRLPEAQRVDSLSVPEAVFVRLKKEGEAGVPVIFSGELRFGYENEAGDTAWNLAVYDLSLPGRERVPLPADSLPLVAGPNRVRYPVAHLPAFVHRHQYLLEVVNSRNEAWRLRFEYHRPEGKAQ